MQNTGLLICSLEFMILILYNPARSNRSEGNILPSQEPLFRLRLKQFFISHHEVRAKTKETATSRVWARNAQSVDWWVQLHSLWWQSWFIYFRAIPSAVCGDAPLHWCLKWLCGCAQWYCQDNHVDLCITWKYTWGSSFILSWQQF